MEYYRHGKSEYSDAAGIINYSLTAANPYDLVFSALRSRRFDAEPYVIAIGKAAVPMAAAASDALGGKIRRGIILTKYAHACSAPENFETLEAGHPVPDENSCAGAEKILDAVSGLSAEDTVILLLSGGGSSLFERPLVPLTRLREITDGLMKKGADINELNCVRKRFSLVKGGRFALCCAPAAVLAYALSDVPGDRLDVIASGPAAPDRSTSADAFAVINKYDIQLNENEKELLREETPKKLDNVTTKIVGNLELLCGAARKMAGDLGYSAEILSVSMRGEASEAGKALAEMALRMRDEHSGQRLALIMGGETTVTVKGSGKGGRNQELALAAAKYIDGAEGIIMFSLGSDGTDGPTDAAGGIVDGRTAGILCEKGLSIDAVLAKNNSYYALKECGGLIMTGPTLTNVNDLAVALIN